MPTHPVLVIHGGAGSRALRGAKLKAVRQSLQRVLEIVYPKLQHGMSALAAVELAASLLEDDPLYNAGKGSKIQSDGKIRMSASIMDGERRRFAGCVNVEGVKNPIFLAKALLRKKDRVLSGAGAKRFARQMGLKFASPYTEHQRQAWKKQKQGKSGTIGAVALDSRGRLAAATSTGGRGFEYPFRVSDSPTTAGNFANSVCAVSATGTGEEIVEYSAASTICALVDAGQSIDRAAERVFRPARSAKCEFAVIAVDYRGRIATPATTPSLIWASADRKGTKFFNK